MRKIFFLLLFPLAIHAQQPILRMTGMDKASIASVEVSAKPDFLATEGAYAWVIDDGNGMIKKLSVTSPGPLLTVRIPGACAAPVIAYGSLWVLSCTAHKLYRLDKNTGAVQAKIATGIADPDGEMSLAAGGGSVWLLSDSTGLLTRIDPQTNKIRASIQVAPHSYCAGYGFNAVWITSTANSTVQKIDPVKNTVLATIPVGRHPRFLAVGHKAVWTLNQGDGTVTRIDGATARVSATIDVQAIGHGGDIAEDGEKVWVVSTNPMRPVQTINTTTNQVEIIYAQYPEDDQPLKVDGAVRAAGAYVWVSGYYRHKVWIFKKTQPRQKPAGRKNQ